MDAVPDIAGDGVPELLLGAMNEDTEGGHAGGVHLLALGAP